MASIKKRDNGRWRARYRDGAGKEHARHFERKVDAQRWLDQVTAAVVTGTYVDPKAGRVTLASYAAHWEGVQVSSTGTRRVVDNALRLHLVPALGGYPIGAVRTTQVQGFVRGLEAKGLSPGTVHGIYHVAQQVFAAAVDDKLISHSPCRRIRLPKLDRDEVVIPGVEDVVALRLRTPRGLWRPAMRETPGQTACVAAAAFCAFMEASLRTRVGCRGPPLG